MIGFGDESHYSWGSMLESSLASGLGAGITPLPNFASTSALIRQQANSNYLTALVPQAIGVELGIGLGMKLGQAAKGETNFTLSQANSNRDAVEDSDGLSLGDDQASAFNPFLAPIAHPHSGHTLLTAESTEANEWPLDTSKGKMSAKPAGPESLAQNNQPALPQTTTGMRKAKAGNNRFGFFQQQSWQETMNQTEEQLLSQSLNIHVKQNTSFANTAVEKMGEIPTWLDAIGEIGKEKSAEILENSEEIERQLKSLGFTKQGLETLQSDGWEQDLTDVEQQIKKLTPLAEEYGTILERTNGMGALGTVSVLMEMSQAGTNTYHVFKTRPQDTFAEGTIDTLNIVSGVAGATAGIKASDIIVGAFIPEIRFFKAAKVGANLIGGALGSSIGFALTDTGGRKITRIPQPYESQQLVIPNNKRTKP
jgi:hypothetical protein